MKTVKREILSTARYDKALRKKRDKLIEDFVRNEFQFFFNVTEYAKVLIDSWKGTFGNCLCGGGVKEPPIPEFLVRKTRPDTPRKSGEDEDVEGEGHAEGEVEGVGEQEEEEEAKAFEGDKFEEMLSEIGEGEDGESVWIEGESEEVIPEEAAPEEEEEVEEQEKEEDLPPLDEEPCTCIKDYMFPYPPEEFDFPFNEERP